jgi:hypothetical protein
VTTNLDQSVSAGNTGVFSAHATDPITKLVISDAACVFDFFAPGKDPEHNPADRTIDHTAVGNFDLRVQGYLAYVQTAGWTPGIWTYRATLTSTYVYSQYANFTLEP